MTRKDYTGIQINYLTAIRCTNERYDREWLWVWRCVCGKEIIKRPSQVKVGHHKSCGCMQQELAHKNIRLPSGEAAFRQMYRSYRRAANDRGLSFELTQDEFKELTKQNCYYCGIPPRQLYQIKSNNTDSYLYNGVDRLNSSEGYIKGNVVSCCGRCNRAKSDLDMSEFLDMIKSIYENLSMEISRPEIRIGK